MRLYYIFLIFIFSFSIISCQDTQNNKEEKIIENIFTDNKANGTFVLYGVKENKFIIYNADRAKKRFSPASTFKIFNSLIALHERVLKNVDEVFYKYKGEKVFLESWAKDSNLRYAISVSQVPAYKELARKIGFEKMKANITKLKYGNEDIGKRVDDFWLDGSLKISAVEQVQLLAKLSQNKLPYSADIQKAVATIIILEENESYILHGKTGLSLNNDGKDIGWFVGWLEKKSNGNIYVFALNIDNENSTYLEKRIDITKEILNNLKVYE